MKFQTMTSSVMAAEVSMKRNAKVANSAHRVVSTVSNKIESSTRNITKQIATSSAGDRDTKKVISSTKQSAGEVAKTAGAMAVGTVKRGTTTMSSCIVTNATLKAYSTMQKSVESAMNITIGSEKANVTKLAVKKIETDNKIYESQRRYSKILEKDTSKYNNALKKTTVSEIRNSTTHYRMVTGIWYRNVKKFPVFIDKQNDVTGIRTVPIGTKIGNRIVESPVKDVNKKDIRVIGVSDHINIGLMKFLSKKSDKLNKKAEKLNSGKYIWKKRLKRGGRLSKSLIRFTAKSLNGSEVMQGLQLSMPALEAGKIGATVAAKTSKKLFLFVGRHSYYQVARAHHKEKIAKDIVAEIERKGVSLSTDQIRDLAERTLRNTGWKKFSTRKIFIRDVRAVKNKFLEKTLPMPIKKVRKKIAQKPIRALTRRAVKRIAKTTFKVGKAIIRAVIKIVKAAIKAMVKAILALLKILMAIGPIGWIIILVVLLIVVIACAVEYSYGGGSSNNGNDTAIYDGTDFIDTSASVMEYIYKEHAAYEKKIHSTAQSMLASGYEAVDIQFENGTADNYKAMYCATMVVIGNDTNNVGDNLPAIIKDLYKKSHSYRKVEYTTASGRKSAHIIVKIQTNENLCYSTCEDDISIDSGFGIGSGNCPKGEVVNDDWMNCLRTVKQLIAATKLPYNQSGWGKINVNGTDYTFRQDCSGYVSVALQVYGAFEMGRAECSASFCDISEIPGFKKYIWSGWDNLQPGDIISKHGHVEIFAYNADGKHYVYSNGSTSGLQNPSVSTDSRTYEVVWRPDNVGSGNSDSSSTEDNIIRPDDNATAEENDEFWQEGWTHPSDYLTVSNTSSITWNKVTQNQDGFQTALKSTVDAKIQNPGLFTSENYVRYNLGFNPMYQDSSKQVNSLDFIRYICAQHGVQVGYSMRSLYEDTVMSSEQSNLTNLEVGDIVFYIPNSNKAKNNSTIKQILSDNGDKTLGETSLSDYMYGDVDKSNNKDNDTWDTEAGNLMIPMICVSEGELVAYCKDVTQSRDGYESSNAQIRTFKVSELKASRVAAVIRPHGYTIDKVFGANNFFAGWTDQKAYGVIAKMNMSYWNGQDYNWESQDYETANDGSIKSGENGSFKLSDFYSEDSIYFIGDVYFRTNSHVNKFRANILYLAIRDYPTSKILPSTAYADAAWKSRYNSTEESLSGNNYWEISKDSSNEADSGVRSDRYQYSVDVNGGWNGSHDTSETSMLFEYYGSVADGWTAYYQKINKELGSSNLQSEYDSNMKIAKDTKTFRDRINKAFSGTYTLTIMSSYTKGYASKDVTMMGSVFSGGDGTGTNASTDKSQCIIADLTAMKTYALLDDLNASTIALNTINNKTSSSSFTKDDYTNLYKTIDDCEKRLSDMYSWINEKKVTLSDGTEVTYSALDVSASDYSSVNMLNNSKINSQITVTKTTLLSASIKENNMWSAYESNPKKYRGVKDVYCKGHTFSYYCAGHDTDNDGKIDTYHTSLVPTFATMSLKQMKAHGLKRDKTSGYLSYGMNSNIPVTYTYASFLAKNGVAYKKCQAMDKKYGTSSLKKCKRKVTFYHATIATENEENCKLSSCAGSHKNHNICTKWTIEYNPEWERWSGYDPKKLKSGYDYSK